ncbi:MAG: hypothetical protein FJ264_17855 [Planctomycetes bacterium]|nr:hypothetical protein [Planctomycetota bacterium]
MDYFDYFDRLRSKLNKEQTDVYRHKISYTSDNHSEQFANLYRDCFSHHTSVAFNYCEDRLCRQSTKTRIIPRDNLTAYFHAKHYITPDLFQSQYDQQGTTISYKDFFDKATETPLTPVVNNKNLQIGSNRRTFLIGEVGEGKSTLIAHMVKDIWKNNNSETSNAPNDSRFKPDFLLLPIYFDVEEKYYCSDGTLKPLKENFFKDLASLITHTIGNSEVMYKRACLIDFVCKMEDDPVYYITLLKKLSGDFFLKPSGFNFKIFLRKFFVL